jgi:cytidylate kinase
MKRAQRLAAEGKMDERKALSAVRDSDKARADFLHRFYGLRDEPPTTYDVVINTDVLSVDQAVKLITTAVRG